MEIRYSILIVADSVEEADKALDKKLLSAFETSQTFKDVMDADVEDDDSYDEGENL